MYGVMSHSLSFKSLIIMLVFFDTVSVYGYTVISETLTSQITGFNHFTVFQASLVIRQNCGNFLRREGVRGVPVLQVAYCSCRSTGLNLTPEPVDCLLPTSKE